MFFENEYILNTDSALAGSDEVGRGPLAGPVVAATVVLTKIEAGLHALGNIGVDDSKKLTQKTRERILTDLNISVDGLNTGAKIKLSGSLKNLGYFSVVEIGAPEIDSINILQASLKAMNESLKFAQNKNAKGAWLVDGNKLPVNIPTCWRAKAIVKGDTKSLVIALASVIAKEYRDKLMQRLALKYPGYGLEKHAGYPTQFHRDAIKELGITKIHRKSFRGVKEFI